MKLKHKIIVSIVILLFIYPINLIAVKSWAQTKDGDALQKIMLDQLDEYDSRLDKVEKKSVMDRFNLTGEYRFEAHSIKASVDPYYNELALQKNLVDTMFYINYKEGVDPSTLNINENFLKNDLATFIGGNYSDYLYFTDNLTFDGLKKMCKDPDFAALMEKLKSKLKPYSKDNGYDADNDRLYTNRLRLNFSSNVTSNLKFRGRLSMYKAWGDSTGVQVFNGQSGSINFDGTTASVPNSDILRVERAFFTYDISKTPGYVSIGRRPSTGGPPLHIRKGTPMGGTPMGTLVDYQFDGITLGLRLEEYLLPGNTFRLCYGVGYESGFGNTPNNGLEDVTMYGFNWDLFYDDDMFIQLMYAKAKNITDGFNGLVVFPVDPITGQEDNSQHIMRYTPSQNLGDLNLGGFVISRHDFSLHYFLSWAYMSSDPENVTTPFGGLFCDGLEKPESQTGNMLYAGARMDLGFPKGLMLGLEYNKGSQYWFNFAMGEDDIVSPKLATRGSVWEAYGIYKLNRWINFRLGLQKYNYEYSQSGWHLGTPKKLDEEPILGFPNYKDVSVISFSTNVRF